MASLRVCHSIQSWLSRLPMFLSFNHSLPLTHSTFFYRLSFSEIIHLYFINMPPSLTSVSLLFTSYSLLTFSIYSSLACSVSVVREFYSALWFRSYLKDWTVRTKTCRMTTSYLILLTHTEAICCCSHFLTACFESIQLRCCSVFVGVWCNPYGLWIITG